MSFKMLLCWPYRSSTARRTRTPGWFKSLIIWHSTIAENCYAGPPLLNVGRRATGAPVIGRKPMQQTTSFDFAATLRAWADITRGVDIPMGTAVAELIQRAELISRRLNDEPIDSIAEELRSDSDAAEL